jgi:hypothetical protein
MQKALETIRAAFWDVAAIWPLLGIRIAGQMAIALIVIMAMIGLAAPAVIGGINSFRDFAPSGDDPARIAVDLLTAHPLLVAYVFLSVLVVVTIAFLAFSFLQAGIVGAYVDSFRSGAAERTWAAGWQRFSAERVVWHGRRSWWRVFLVYNIVWAIASTILLIPLAIAMFLVIRNAASESIAAIGCASLGGIVLLLIPIAFIASVWSNLAVIATVGQDLDATPAVSVAWAQIRQRFGRIVTLVAILFVISIGVVLALMFAHLTIAFLSAAPGVGLILFPVQIALSFIQSVVVTFLSSWGITAFIRFAFEDAGAVDAV